MELDTDVARDWIAAARSLQATMERFPQRRATDDAVGVTTQAGNITVRVEDAKTPRMVSMAVHAAILCAVLSIITLLGGGMLYLNMKDHLDAIYMMAPQLKPETVTHEHHHPDPGAQADRQLDGRQSAGNRPDPGDATDVGIPASGRP